MDEVTTVDELEALPPNTVIAQFFPADQYGHPPGILVYRRVYPGYYGDGWASMGTDGIFSSDVMVSAMLRATPRVFRVLYRPDKEE